MSTIITIRVVIPRDISKDAVKDVGRDIRRDYFSEASVYDFSTTNENVFNNFGQGECIPQANGPDVLRGTQSIKAACKYHQSQLCLDECTDEIHDDTCLVGIMDVVIPLLEAEEVRNPEFAKATVRKVLE